MVFEILSHFAGVTLVIIGFASALYMYTVGAVMRLFEVNLLEGGYQALSATIAIIALFIAFATALFSAASKRRDMLDNQKRHDEMLAEIRQGHQEREDTRKVLLALQQTLQQIVQQSDSHKDAAQKPANVRRQRDNCI